MNSFSIKVWELNKKFKSIKLKENEGNNANKKIPKPKTRLSSSQGRSNQSSKIIAESQWAEEEDSSEVEEGEEVDEESEEERKTDYIRRKKVTNGSYAQSAPNEIVDFKQKIPEQYKNIKKIFIDAIRKTCQFLRFRLCLNIQRLA